MNTVSQLLPPPKKTHTGRRRLAAVTVATLAVALAGGAAPALAQPAPDSPISYVAGKGQGSGDWGLVGDITTLGSGTTFNYGVAVNPVDGSLWVTDSGKISYGSLACSIGGAGAAPCQLGTPRVLAYPKVTASDTSVSAYTGNGTYAPATVSNDGLGKLWSESADRSVHPLGTGGSANQTNGPRGITFTPDGTSWIPNSESLAPVGGTPGVIVRYDAAGNDLVGAGWTGTWLQYDLPGVHFYPTGAATTPEGTVLVTSATNNRLWEYNADGTVKRKILLDIPASEGQPAQGRNPYSVAVDPVDGSIYVGLQGFRDDTPTAEPFLEKRDADGNVIGQFTAEGVLKKGQVVFGTAVNPVTQHVYAWSESGNIAEWDSKGTFIGSFGSGSTATPAPSTQNLMPGLSSTRGLAFDDRGRMLVSVGQGTGSARVMMLAQTPNPIAGLTAATDATSVDLSWDALPGESATPYGQADLLDYTVEYRAEGATEWTLAESPVSTTASATVTGLTTGTSYEFRVTGYNEAGAGTPAVITATPKLAPAQLTVVKTGNGTVAESADDPIHVDADSDVAFEYVVTNPGPAEVTEVNLEDSVLGTVEAPEDFTGSLAAEQSVTFTATGAVAAGEYHNTATVTGMSEDESVTATADWYGFGDAATPAPTPTPTINPIPSPTDPGSPVPPAAGGNDGGLAQTGAIAATTAILIAAALALLGSVIYFGVRRRSGRIE